MDNTQMQTTANTNPPIQTKVKTEPVKEDDMSWRDYHPSPTTDDGDIPMSVEHNSASMTPPADSSSPPQASAAASSGQDLFDMTPDMEQAMRELELRKRTAEFEENFDYDMMLYDDSAPPEYDVREKLDSLNALLANEPDPPEPEHRNSRVAFRQELVSLVAPSPTDQEEEEEGDAGEQPTGDDKHSVEAASPTNPEDPLLSTPRGVEPSLPSKTTSEARLASSFSGSEDELDDQDEDVKKGKSISQMQPQQPRSFADGETVNANKEDAAVHQILQSGSWRDSYPDDQAKSHQSHQEHQEKQHVEQKQLPPQVKTGVKEGESESENSQNGMLVNRNGEYQLVDRNDMIGLSSEVEPQPSRSVSTAGNYHDVKEMRSSNKSGKIAGRPKSAPANKVQINNNLSSSSGSTRSDIDVPRVDRAALDRQKKRKEQKERERKEKEEEENEQKREENKKIFDAWLKKKLETQRAEEDQRKQQEQSVKDLREEQVGRRRVEIREKEKKLLQKLEEDRHKDEKMREYRIREMEDATALHTKDECKKAFNEWLKRKQREHRQKVVEERQRARVTRLALRQCRKSQNLAQAIYDANSFRYLDYCGYP